MSENQGQTRLQKMALDLHLAEQYAGRLQQHLQSALVEFEASVNGDDRQPCEQKMKTDIDQALGELNTFATWLAQSFEKQVVQLILKAYRCGDEVPVGSEESKLQVGK